MELYIPEETDFIADYQQRRRSAAIRRMIKPIDQPKIHLLLGLSVGATVTGLIMAAWGAIGLWLH